MMGKKYLPIVSIAVVLMACQNNPTSGPVSAETKEIAELFQVVSNPEIYKSNQINAEKWLVSLNKPWSIEFILAEENSKLKIDATK